MCVTEGKLVSQTFLHIIKSSQLGSSVLHTLNSEPLNRKQVELL